MAKKVDWIASIKGSAPVRGLAKRAVDVLDKRERNATTGVWHQPAAAWALQGIRLFEHLSKADVARLSTDANIETYEKRTTTLFDDDQGLIWFVLSGGVKLSRSCSLGQRLIEAILSPGDMFGRMSRATSGVAYELQALETTRIAGLSRARFEDFLASHPALGCAVVQHLEERERKLVRRLESLVFKDVHERVAETLLELARDHAEPCAHGFAVDVRLNQTDLAELVGASRQMVNRVLGDFERRLYIQRMGPVLCVLHKERLERFARDSETARLSNR
jgi:CRP/FNR family transcriptional regulator, cyclic AMP receptor protein